MSDGLVVGGLDFFEFIKFSCERIVRRREKERRNRGAELNLDFRRIIGREKEISKVKRNSFFIGFKKMLPRSFPSHEFDLQFKFCLFRHTF